MTPLLSTFTVSLLSKMGHLPVLLVITGISMVQPSIAAHVNTAMEHLLYVDSQATEEHLNIKDLANQNILEILGDYLTPRGEKVSPLARGLDNITSRF